MARMSKQPVGWKPRPWSIALWAVIAALLLAPLVAMRFTSEVNWTASDFAFAGALLIGGGVALECVARLIRKPRTRALVGAAILAVVALVWAESAVGLF